jgi:hypothetical protein
MNRMQKNDDSVLVWQIHAKRQSHLIWSCLQDMAYAATKKALRPTLPPSCILHLHQENLSMSLHK